MDSGTKPICRAIMRYITLHDSYIWYFNPITLTNPEYNYNFNLFRNWFKMPELEFIYFPIHGRAFIARTIMQMGDVACKDTIVTFEEFAKMKTGMS